MKKLIFFQTFILIAFLPSVAQPTWHKVNYNELTSAEAIFEFNDTLIIFDWAFSKCYLHYLYNKSKWEKKEIKTDRNVQAVYFVNSKVGWGLTVGSESNPEKVYKTTDAGETWHNIFQFPKHISSSQIERGMLQFFQNGVGYIASDRYPENLYKTIDGGNSFYSIAKLESAIYGINFFTDMEGFVVGNPFVYFCKNNNNSIVKVTSGSNLTCLFIPTSESPTSISMLNTNVAWFHTGQSLLKTNDGGSSFIKISIPDSCKGSHNKVQIINNNLLWANSSNFIFYTEEANKNQNPLKWNVYKLDNYIKDFQIIKNGTEGWAISNTSLYHYPSPIVSVSKNHDYTKQCVSLWPNPSHNILIIRCYNHFYNDTISIFNIYGQQVYEGVMDTIEKEINISNLSQGLYFVKINNIIASFTKI